MRQIDYTTIHADLSMLRTKLKKLLDACDVWLSAGTTRYDIGLRAEEVSVIVTLTADDGRTETRRENLAQLLADLEAGFERKPIYDVKMPDLRNFTLLTIREIRATLMACADLYRQSLEMDNLMRLRDELIACIEETDDETKNRLNEMFRCYLVERRDPAGGSRRRSVRKRIVS